MKSGDVKACVAMMSIAAVLIVTVFLGYNHTIITLGIGFIGYLGGYLRAIEKYDTTIPREPSQLHLQPSSRRP